MVLPRPAAWDIHYAAVAAQRAGEDAIVLSVGDPDFATPAFITDAAAEPEARLGSRSNGG
jgi:aspartate/methionine/tyrosine aminotransferase